jgi:hypothetical protein
MFHHVDRVKFSDLPWRTLQRVHPMLLYAQNLEMWPAQIGLGHDIWRNFRTGRAAGEENTQNGDEFHAACWHESCGSQPIDKNPPCATVPHGSHRIFRHRRGDRPGHLGDSPFSADSGSDQNHHSVGGSRRFNPVAARRHRHPRIRRKNSKISIASERSSGYKFHMTRRFSEITQHAGRGSNSQPSGERDGLYLERGNAPAVSVASFAGMRKAAHAKNQSCPGDVPMDCKTGYGLLTGSCRVPRPFLLALK